MAFFSKALLTTMRAAPTTIATQLAKQSPSIAATPFRSFHKGVMQTGSLYSHEIGQRQIVSKHETFRRYNFGFSFSEGRVSNIGVDYIIDKTDAVLYLTFRDNEALRDYRNNIENTCRVPTRTTPSIQFITGSTQYRMPPTMCISLTEENLIESSISKVLTTLCSLIPELKLTKRQLKDLEYVAKKALITYEHRSRLYLLSEPSTFEPSKG